MRKKDLNVESITKILQKDFIVDKVQVSIENDVTIFTIEDTTSHLQKDEKKARVRFLDKINAFNKKLPINFHVKG